LLEGDAAREYTNRLSAMQDALGELNDLNTVTALLADVREGVDPGALAEFDAACEFCRGWSTGAASGIVARADEQLNAFQELAAKVDDGRGR
jgi:CHAD domain-containing protein